MIAQLPFWVNKPAAIQSWRYRRWWLGVASLLIMGFEMGVSAASAVAQSTIVPDDTLGAETSRVSPEGVSREVIEGGAQRDANLFHSFREFNVAEDQAAYFANPAGIENILVRVTGGNRSDILGTLGVLEGNADLFLLNPNGIFFGPNAQLDIGGSFVATSAEALQFRTQGLFSASNPETPPLLTVNPSAFLFNQINPGAINSQANLRVDPGQSVLLLGGHISLNGEHLGLLENPERYSILAQGGRIELGSVNALGAVQLNQQENRWILDYGGIEAFGQVALGNGAIVNAGVKGGGDIHVQAANLILQEGSRITNRPDAGEVMGGSLTVTTTDLVELSGILETPIRTFAGGLFTGSESEGGDSGDLTISTRRLIVRDGAAVSATVFFNDSNAGNVRIIASESVELIGFAIGDSPTEAGQQFLNSNLATGTFGDGKVGDLQIDTQRLTVRDGAAIIAATSNGIQGGNVIINASESMVVSGTSGLISLEGISPESIEVPSGVITGVTSTEPLPTRSRPQDLGNLTINTQSLSVEDGAIITASALGLGEGGNLVINASESVRLSGVSSQGWRSGLYSQNLAAGNGGNLTINTRGLNVSDSAIISVASERQFGGSEAVFQGVLKAYLAELDLEDLFPPNDLESGDAGTLEVQAESIVLDNRADIRAVADSGNGGNILLSGSGQQSLDLLIMRNGSRISTNAGNAEAGGSGGNITINADFLVSIPNENSDITANAFEGPGGTITITAHGIFGFKSQSVDELRAALAPGDSLDPVNLASNDITAISQTNPSLSGRVIFNGLNVDLNQGLEAVPIEIVSTEVAQGCYAEAEGTQSEFVVVGRGGLPPAPSDVHSSDNTQVDLVTIKPNDNPAGRAGRRSGNRDEATAFNFMPSPFQPFIVEAQEWMRNEQGQVVLVAQTSATPTYRPWPDPVGCRRLQLGAKG